MQKSVELKAAAGGASVALAVLQEALGEACGQGQGVAASEVAKALAVIAQLVEEAAAGRDPLQVTDDWSAPAAWPQFPHWDRWAWAIRTLAVASGTRAHCAQKYGYLRVDIGPARTPELTAALSELADLMERASDTED